MSRATEIHGFEANVLINGTAYRAAKVTIRETVDEGDVTSFLSPTEARGGSASASVVFEERKPTKTRAEVTVEKPTLDTLENPFVTPFFLRTGAVVNLFVTFDAAIIMSFNCQHFLITSVEPSADVGNLQPLSFTGKTDGLYRLD